MKELTLKQKITFCNWYLLLKEWEFICLAFLNFLYYHNKPRVRDADTLSFKILFPELHEMIMTVGKELDPDFEWGLAWNDPIDNRTFRDTKIQELKTQLEKQR